MIPRGALAGNYPSQSMQNQPPASSTHGSLFRKRSRFLGQASLANDATAHSNTPLSIASTDRASSASERSGNTSVLIRRSASLRPRRPSSPSSNELAYSHQADKRSVSSVSTGVNAEKALDNLFRSPTSPEDVRPSRASSFSQSVRRDESNGPQANGASGQGGYIQTVQGSQDSRAAYHHIQAMSSKRMSTLDYLRKAHEGRAYWFNTLLLDQSDLSKMPYFDPRKLGRRATNYLLLGLSLPTIMDPNTNAPAEYLRTFNALLNEFETYSSIHSPDGTTSSLTRTRLPQMFRRHAPSISSKNRRSSSADALSPQDSNERSFSGGNITAFSASYASFPHGEQELIPGEEYTYLLTPSLPFEPDYSETFATLCDVLIDCYTKIMTLVSSPELCVPGLGDLFGKADAKIRKILVASVVKDFEEASKQGVRSEIAGIGRLVLGGLA